MICPSCEQNVFIGAERCPHCEFDYPKLKRQAEGKVIRVAFLQDFENQLSPSSTRHIEKLLNKLHKELLGVAVMVILDDTPTEASALHALFYLNESEWTHEEDLPAFESERFLLYINSASQEARIALSYGLEQLTQHIDWQEVILKNHSLLYQGLYSEVIIDVLKSLRNTIRGLANSSKR